MPNGSIQLKQNSLKKYLAKLNEHFVYNRFLYIYYRSGGIERDYQYFSPVKKYETKYDDKGREMFCEDDYSCVYDFLFAKVVSNDRLEKYIHQEIGKLDSIEQSYEPTKPINKYRLEWTESKTALVELLYALLESGCINGGKTDIKELAGSVKRIFPNIDLSDYYRTYVDIKNRKNNRTKFIDTLKKSLTERLERDEEK
jgi:hypothetical protein